MRKAIVGALLAVSVVVMAGFVYARGPMGGGAGFCGRSDCPNAGATATEQWQKFRSDSLGLRERMMIKQFELEKENIQPNPDRAKIAKLETDMAGLQSNIQGLRDKAGLADCRQDCRNNSATSSCGYSMGNCGRGMGRCNQ